MGQQDRHIGGRQATDFPIERCLNVDLLVHSQSPFFLRIRVHKLAAFAVQGETAACCSIKPKMMPAGEASRNIGRDRFRCCT